MERSTTFDNTSENLLNMFGVQHLLRGQKGDKLRAKSYFDKALQYSRDDLTLSNRAILLADAGATREALDLTREALKTAKAAPRSPLSVWSVPLNMARYTAQLGDTAGAKKLLTELLEDETVPTWAAMSARQQLKGIEEGTVEQEGSGTLPHVPGARHAEVVERERRLTVKLYERMVCEECRKILGWHSCEAEYLVPGLTEIGDLDSYGISTERGEAEVVCVGECKLRFESEDLVDHSEMSQLVNGKLGPLRKFMDENDDVRSLRGFFFANAGYNEDARELARMEGIRIFRTKMSRDWRNRDDWGLSLEKIDP